MLRTVISIAFLSAFLAVTPAMSVEVDTEKCEKSAQCGTSQCASSNCAASNCAASQCEKGQCKASACSEEKCASFTVASDDCEKSQCSAGTCEGTTGQSTTARLIQVTTTLGSGAETACKGNKQCCSGDLVSSKTCCSDEQKTCCSEEVEICCSEVASCCSEEKGFCAIANLVAKNDSCVGCSECPAGLASDASNVTSCECGDGCGCCADAEQKYQNQIVALHWKLMEQSTKNAVLTAQLKHSETLAKTHVEFAQQLLKKEVENVQLQAELKLANLHNEASQEIAGTTFECERVKAALELAHQHNDQLKHELAQRASNHSQALGAFKTANAGLAARVAELENQLKSINMRLATQPNAIQVK